jgi:hypothetical protein
MMVLVMSLTDALTVVDHELKRGSHLAATRLGTGLPHDETARHLRRLRRRRLRGRLSRSTPDRGSVSADVTISGLLA